VFEKSTAQVDSFAIGRLKNEGAVILGKTNAPEFGTRPITEGPMFPPARNPLDKTRTAGGSSGGAAAAVAAGLCALSQGGDGGGSIRIPASCCGVVGLKPSRGRISSGPLFGEDWAGLATSGVIGRTVADVALGLDAMSGHLPGDPYWAEIPEPFLAAAQRKPETLRVGWTIDAPAAVDPEVAAAVESIAGELARLGHRVSRLKPDLGQFRPLIQILAVTAVGALPITTPELLDPLNRRMFQAAPLSTAVDYLKALTELHQQARRLIATWDQIDVLLTPTLTYPAPKLGTLGQDVDTASGEFLDWLSFTHPFNGTGQPAISLPLATSKAGLPIGIQLVGPPRDEYSILSLGAQLESVVRPPAAVSSRA
jgi:amidase